jgi:ribonuclease P protein component
VPPAGFPKSARLLKRREFLKVYEEGKRLPGSLFTVFFLAPGAQAGPRAGFTTPRALGKAFVRNRIRRRMREAVRLEFWRLRSSIDLVFHPRGAAATVPFPRLRAEVVKALSRCVAS